MAEKKRSTPPAVFSLVFSLSVKQHVQMDNRRYIWEWRYREGRSQKELTDDDGNIIPLDDVIRIHRDTDRMRVTGVC